MEVCIHHKFKNTATGYFQSRFPLNNIPNKCHITKLASKYTDSSLANLGKNIVQSRYGLSVVLLCFWGALDLCCMVQLCPDKKKNIEGINSNKRIVLRTHQRQQKRRKLEGWETLTLLMTWKSLPASSLRGFLSSLGLAEITVLRS